MADPLVPWLDGYVTEAHACLLSHPDAATCRAYLKARRVPEALWAEYRLGYAHPDLDAAGTGSWALWRRIYLTERLVLPLTAYEGSVIGLQSRSLETKDYRQFYALDSKVWPMFFGLGPAVDEIWRTGQAVIVEGAFDCLATRLVCRNVVATLTANTPGTCRTWLRRFVTRLTALLDMDEPGRKAAFRLVQDGAPYQMVVPQYGAHDPADLLAQQGAAALQRAVGHVGDVVW